MRKKSPGNKYKIIINNEIITGFIFLLLLALTALVSCSKDIVKKEDADGLNLEYCQEGLISKNTYRVIIVDPKDGSKIDVAALAKRRALISLQKYLKSDDARIVKESTAVLLNMIDRYGILRKEASGKRRDVYFFEINKNDLDKFLNDLANRR